MTTLAQAAEFYALRGAVRAIETLSWPRAGAFGAWIGGLGYRPLGIRRAVVEQQIAAAFPEMTQSDVERTARAAYRHLGRNAAEIALAPRLGRQGLVDLFEQVDNWDWVERAMAAGRGIIAVTGHVGNWELGGAYFAARGIPIDAIARRQANPLFDEYITRTRADMGMVIVHDHEAVRRTARSLRDGRLVAFLADQGVKGLASTFVPFFGRPAKTPRGAAVFALRGDVPIVMIHAVRQRDERYELAAEELPVTHTGDRERDVDDVMLRFSQALERMVRKYPGQYFWQHRRWKHQPEDTPPELREP